MLKDLFRIIFERSDLVKGTICQGFFDIANGALLPIWLKLMGINALGVGGLLAVNAALKSLISPFVARLSHANFWHSVRLGLTFNVMGWIPWLISSNPFAMLISSVFWSAGRYLYNTSLDTQWYKQRRTVSMASREILLGVGRLACILVTVPILYLFYNFFVIVSLGFSMFALLLVVFHFSSSYKIKEAV